MLASLLDSVPFVLDDGDRAARFPIPGKNFRVQYPNGDIKQFDGAAWNLLMSGGKAPAGGRTITDLTTYILNNAVLNIKDFAAPGVDISTNVNEAGNALNAAIVAANAYGLGGAGVYIPPGDYKIAVLVICLSNVRIFGDQTSTTIHWNRGGASGFLAQGRTNIVVEGIRTTGNCAINFLFDQCSAITFRRCNVTGGTIQDAATGYSGGVFATLTDDIEVADCSFSGNGNTTPGFLSADIQINGNGVTVLGNERIRLLNNRCTSTSVQMNIGCYDMQKSIIAGNFCSGAKTGAGNNNGYGIMIYKTAVSGAGACHDNNVHHNTIWGVQGSGIYIQAGLRTMCNANLLYDVSSVQDDTTLVASGIGYSNCSEGVITANIILLSGKCGIIVAGVSGSDGFTISANMVDGCATRQGICVRGPLSHSAITGNMVTNCLAGIGTITGIDFNVVSITCTGNAVYATIGISQGIVFQGITYSDVSSNTVLNSGGDSISIVNANMCGVENNTCVNGSQGNNNSYSAVNIVNGTRCHVVGNKGGNTGATGFKYGVAFFGTCTKSASLANNFDGCLTANFLAIPAAQSILSAGNQDGSANPGIWQTVQSIILTGSPTNVTQVLLGSSSAAGSVGTAFASAATVLAGNAQQLLGVDTWHQSLAANPSKLIRLTPAGDIEFFHAIAGKADGTSATFWGTPTHAFRSNGTIVVNGIQVIGPRSTGWTAMTGAQDKVSVFDVTTVTLAQLAQRVNAMQSTLTASHGLFGP